MTTHTTHRLRARATAMQWVLVLLFLVLAGQFFRVQILEHDRYRLRSQDNRLREVTLAAPRGPILDRHGHVIAENAPGYTVKLFSTSADSLAAVLERFRALVPLDSTTVRQVLSRYRAAPYQPALVLASGSFETIARLEEHRMSLPGLVIQTEPRRRYPAGPAVAHIVGYVSEVSERDLETNRYPGARLSTIVGKDGLEQVYDSILRGIDGVRYIEVNARGRMVREEATAPSRSPIAGNPLTTTVDLPLQLFIDSLWNAMYPGMHGAVVAVRPDGGVLAMYSAPSFDPNDFVGGISTERYREYTAPAAGKPLLNRAIRGTYPPASPFKLATAAMGLRRGLVTPTTRMEQPCRGGFRFGNRVWRCWKRDGHGSLDLIGAMAQSCDVYFYQLGMRIGLAGMLEDGTRMGFNERSGIDLESEVRSTYPPSTAYFDRLYGPRGWTMAVTLNLSIGQGENSQSLINMVRFYQALAGDGVIHPPFFVAARSEMRPVDLDLSPEILDGLRRSMEAVVQWGTARGARGQDLSWAGKTGTAQNPHGEDHGWFLGFAPVERPEIVVGAILEYGLHGSSVAPFVARVIRRFLEPAAVDRPPAVPLLFPADTAPRDVSIATDTLGVSP